MMLTLMQEVSTREVSRNLVEQLVSYSVLHSVAPVPEQFFTRGLMRDSINQKRICTPEYFNLLLVAVDNSLQCRHLSKGYLTLLLEVVHALLLSVGAEHGDEGVVTSLLQLLSASVHRLPLNAVDHVLLHDAHTAVVFHSHQR